MFERILFATDGSLLAEEAVSTAIDLAKPRRSELRVVSVLEPSLHYGSQEPEQGFFDNEYFRRMRTELEDQSKRAAERIKAHFDEAKLESSVVVRRGHAAAEIVAEAAEWNADVIVMSTHGRRGILREVLGSVANEVVAAAPCPIVLYRRKRSKH